jgi:hypothetical protein
MNKVILLVSFLVLSFCANAQADKNKSSQANPKHLSFVKEGIGLAKFHSEEELNVMNKLELTKLYMERVNYLVEVIPYLALHSQPGATFYDMSIPETPENVQHLAKEIKNKDAFLSSVKVTLKDIIPYSDKVSIVWCILFYENVIKKSSEGFGTQLPKGQAHAKPYIPAENESQKQVVPQDTTAKNKKAE